jgi:hypothetical protein
MQEKLRLALRKATALDKECGGNGVPFEAFEGYAKAYPSLSANQLAALASFNVSSQGAARTMVDLAVSGGKWLLVPTLIAGAWKTTDERARREAEKTLWNCER